MRTAYIIHDPQDRALVEHTLVRPLPTLGIDRWVSSSHFQAATADASSSIAQAMESSEVIIAVISGAAAASDRVRSEVGLALACRRPLIPVRIDATDPAQLAAGLSALPAVAVRAAGASTDLDHLRRALADLFPPPADAVDDDELLLEAVPADYRDREGFDPDFLGDGITVSLPAVTGDPDDVLTFEVEGQTEQELRYEHFSVVMSRSRRLCLFSAVNIAGAESKRKRRVGWRIDPRIPRESQIRSECYGDPPRFARGHMTRREDPVWGDDASAATGNADSMHVTNAVPQMQPFNAGIWLGLEDYALDHAREDDMRICVITGPYLKADDPIRFDVQIPRRFWKVIAFVHDDTGQPCATGYAMSQDAFIREDEFVFGQHETFQVSIAAIERQTGLSFGPLAALDPFEEVEEALAAPLRDFAQIRFVRRR
jgi:DNA/RNA endonuclease G (NUC1)